MRQCTPTNSIPSITTTVDFRSTVRPVPVRGSASSWRPCAAALVELLSPFEADEGKAPAGRTPGLPGMGSLLLPPWTVTRYGTDGVEMRGSFSRFHVGGNSAVHGGVLPLLFDHMFGMISHAAGRPISRTAFLHVDYRRITPIDVPLIVRGRVTNTEGRKAFVCAELFDSDETLLAEGNGLMVRLLPGQP